LALTSGGATAVLRFVWPRLVFTEDKFVTEAEAMGAQWISRGMFYVASFGAAEIGYRFRRGVVSFDVTWRDPKYSLRWKLVQKRLQASNGCISAKEVWSLVDSRAPVVIRLPGDMASDGELQYVKERLITGMKGAYVELWLQRYNERELIACSVSAVGSSNVDKADDVLVLGYAPPWDSEALRNSIHLACEFGLRYADAASVLEGPGWPGQAP
jgi:hypothetical protein